MMPCLAHRAPTRPNDGWCRAPASVAGARPRLHRTSRTAASPLPQLWKSAPAQPNARFACVGPSLGPGASPPGPSNARGAGGTGVRGLAGVLRSVRHDAVGEDCSFVGRAASPLCLWCPALPIRLRRVVLPRQNPPPPLVRGQSPALGDVELAQGVDFDSHKKKIATSRRGRDRRGKRRVSDRSSPRCGAETQDHYGPIRVASTRFGPA